MPRRLPIVLLALLCTCGAAAAATGRISDEPLQAQEWWLARVGADPAAAPGPGVPIAIVDSGVDPTDAEFAGRPNTTFFNGQTVVGREEFHGTAVASIAAAPVNGQGIAGVYPQAALEIFDASPDFRGITDFLAIAGVDAAAARCPGVINLSFGSTEADPLLRDAILGAVHNGCLVVAAAGNNGEEGNPVTYPASYPHVLTVGATDESDQVASFSTLSPAVDVAAPGVDIVGAVPLSRNPGGYDTGLAGTSFAAPIVSAAAAWVWTLRPTLSVTQLAQLLRSSARDVGAPGFDTGSGWGVVDVPAALTAPAPQNDPGEPNDDVDQVKPGALFADGRPALTTPARPSNRIAGTLDQAEDPRDLYRVWVPANRVLRVTAASGGDATAVLWGPQTASVDEGLAPRRRDLKGQSVRAGEKGFAAYVEVMLTGRSRSAGYLLSVTASKR